MKKICLLVWMISITFSVFCQTNQWAWIGGANTSLDYAVYGTKGVADPANKPGARYNSLSWTDVSGNLWLFGGDGNTATSTGLLNDLWKYNTSTRQWTWISGDSIPFASSVYGTKGIADPTNKPGARIGAVSWKDASNNLWLFGGSSIFGLNNDLWRYDIGTGLWTWVSGDNGYNVPGVFGTKGIPDAANKPGGKNNATSWNDASDNLWLFAGEQDGTTNEYYNDLWKYNISSGQWTWMSGDNTPFSDGVYGTKGVADPANTPGARYESPSWTDHAGNLWLFGGEAHTSAPQGNANDLWKYDITLHEWIWVSGDNTLNQPGVYGTKGVADPANKPAGKWSGTTWTDADGNLWMFGGFGTYTSTINWFFNTMWKYDISLNEWTWVTGYNTAFTTGVYGTMDVYDPANTPGARWGSVGWADATGSFYLFGGFSTSTMVDYFNDLWNFNPATLVPLNLVEFSAQQQNSNAIINWQTENESNLSWFEVERSTDGSNFTAITKINATNTSTRHRYAYLDEHLPKAADVFYRLKINSADNNNTYSKIAKININNPQIIKWGPNPAKDHLTISGEQLCLLKLYDSKGILIKSAALQDHESTTINLSGIAPNVYFIRIYDIYGKATVKKIIIE